MEFILIDLKINNNDNSHFIACEVLGVHIYSYSQNAGLTNSLLPNALQGLISVSVKSYAYL